MLANVHARATDRCKWLVRPQEYVGSFETGVIDNCELSSMDDKNPTKA